MMRLLDHTDADAERYCLNTEWTAACHCPVRNSEGACKADGTLSPCTGSEPWQEDPIMQRIVLVTLFGGLTAALVAEPAPPSEAKAAQLIAPFFTPPKEFAEDFGAYK